MCALRRIAGVRCTAAAPSSWGRAGAGSRPSAAAAPGGCGVGAALLRRPVQDGDAGALRCRRLGQRCFAIYHTPASPASLDWSVEHQVKTAAWATRLRPALDALLADRSKELSRAELEELCPALRPDIVGGLFDTFGSHPRGGKVSYRELVAYLLMAGGRGSSQDVLEAVFPLCDAEASGVASLDELLKALQLFYFVRFRDAGFVEYKAAGLAAELSSVLEGGLPTEPPGAAASKGSSPEAAADAGEGAAPAAPEAAASGSEPAAGSEGGAGSGPAPAASAAPVGPSTAAGGDQDGASAGVSEPSPEEGGEGSHTPEEAAAGHSVERPAGAASPEAAPASAAAPPATLTLPQFVTWARSDLPQAQELRHMASEFAKQADLGSGQEPDFLLPVRAKATWEKIKVSHPIVEVDGDEMMRIVWQMIKEKLIFPFLDMEIDYYDLSITYRDETDDLVTMDAVKAIRTHGVGIKCPTITPDGARVLEFNLKEQWKSPSQTIQKILGGTNFREPVILSSIPHSIASWRRPIVVCRPPQETASIASDVPGTFKIVFEPEDGSGATEVPVHRFASAGGGVAFGACTTRARIETFAKSCFEYALSEGMPLYVSTRNAALKEYDGLFLDTFSAMYQASYKRAFEERGISYHSKPIGSVIGKALTSEGGFVWACTEGDSETQSDFVAQGYGDAALLKSTHLCADGRTCFIEASHGTITRHYRAHQRGEKAVTNPIATIFCWSRGLAHRAKLDGNERLAEFSKALEAACDNCVRNGRMSKDLAARAFGEHGAPGRWLATEDFLQAIANELKLALLKRPRSAS